MIQLFFTDVDGDDYSEMWGFTTRNDSIFLNAIEPFDSVSPFSVRLRYLDKICRKYYKKDDLSINFGAVTDINGDGHEEFVFYLQGVFHQATEVIHLLSGQRQAAGKGITGVDTGRPGILLRI
ncbi:MAG: hypothetical protein U5L09_18050 [Bacteroidales bacterium]|nr:hypothetical protein [Bacteroidales bacterium]